MENIRLFMIIPPGLEDLALQELKLKCPVDKFEVIKGGVELNASLEWIEQAHLLLKIPTRILMRITDFKVRDFPKLYQKFLNFKWNTYLSHPEPNWEISCSKSRLNHTGRMEETIKSALSEALKKQPLSLDWQKKNYPPQTFYIRLVNDECTLSLDLTGDPLYKRGLQKIKGEAPLRENFAASFIFELTQDIKTPFTLVDPMCGSGTFLTEALSFYQPLHLRPFAFETAPFYKGKTLKIPKSADSLPIIETMGFDLNAELIKKVEVACAGLPIKFFAQDSLKTPLELPQKTIMICNPPYGERIKIEGKRGTFLKDAWKKFLTTDKPWRFAWVLPSDMDDLFSRPSGYTLKSKRHLKNGGISVTFWIWELI